MRAWSVKSGLRVTEPVGSSGLTRRGAIGKQALRVAGEHVDAREAGPLLVRLEELGRLPALDPAAAQLARSFTRPRSPSSPRSNRPRPSRQTTPSDHGPRPRSRWRRSATDVGLLLLEPLELDRGAEAGERRAAAGVQAKPAELGGREAGRGRRTSAAHGATRAGVGRRADDPPLHRARLARQDQLAAERAEERVGDGRRAAPGAARAGAGPRWPRTGHAGSGGRTACGRRRSRGRSASRSNASSFVARRSRAPSGAARRPRARTEARRRGSRRATSGWRRSLRAPRARASTGLWA